jgi:hypothetical protein
VSLRNERLFILPLQGSFSNAIAEHSGRRRRRYQISFEYHKVFLMQTIESKHDFDLNKEN